MNAKAKGYVLGAIAAATYGMNPLFALPLYKAGMNPDSVLFFRYLFAIPVLGIMIKARGRNFKLKPNEIVPLILMGLLVSFSSLALFQSYNYMEAGIASTVCLSDLSGADHGVCLQGEINVTNHLLYLAGIRRYRLTL